MDGSYNQPFGHGHGHGHGHGPSQLNSPQTPSSATYQTNVNRSKTRKWVEARQQTYDGDDWGTDDFEQEPDSPPYQQPAAPSSSRLASYGQRTPSSTVAPDSTNPPALHIPTQHAAPPAQVAHYPADPAAPSHFSGAPATADSSHTKLPEHPVPLETSNAYGSSDAPPQHTSAPGFPASQPAAPSYAEHTDHFGRVERKNTTRKPVGGAKPLTETAMSDAPPVPEKPEQHITATQQDDVPAVPPAQEDEVPALANAEDIDRHRLSTSPQLPDVARMSAFGVDLFSGNTKRVSAMGPPPTVEEAEPPAPVTQSPVEKPAEKAEASGMERDIAAADVLQPSAGAPISDTAAEQESTAVESTDTLPTGAATVEKTAADAPSHMWRPSVPGEQAADGEPASAAVNKTQEHDVSPVSEHDPEAGAATNTQAVPNDQEQPATLKPTHDVPTIAPLRTPSPRTSQVALATVSATAEEGPSDPEPLQTGAPAPAPIETDDSRVPEYSPSDYDPKSLHREATFSTVTSSPLKESDILRDEIIKSLSPQHDTAPVSFPPSLPQEPASEPAKSAPRESTYTLSGYDSYWAEKDRGAQPTVAEEQEGPNVIESVPEEQAATTPKQLEATPVVAEAEQKSPPMDGDGRRRFSWEMEREETAPVPAQGDDTVRSPVDQVKATDDERIPSPSVNVVVDAPETEEPQHTAAMSGGVSHQVSQASSSRQPAGRAQLATPEPPSPVSDPSERNQAPAAEDRRPSLAEQKSLVRSEATPVAPSPPSGTHPALAISPTASQTPATQAPLMTFREIMGLPSAQERISKYDEARTRFATIESGLSDWIANLKASHPDHANATGSFGGSLVAPGGDPSTIPSPVGGQAPPQQPYYQQYLNASSPTVATAPGRSRLGGISSGQSHSAFGHSSDKIGTKSKELMQTAGKMGKGLFSKGKSKLRGTGDKQADSSPPSTPVQGKTKSDRRSSWALSLGNRSRTEGMGMHSSADKPGHPPMGQSPQPSTETGRSSMALNRPGPEQNSFRGPEGPSSRSGLVGSDLRHDANEPAPSTPNRGDRAGHNRDVSLPLTLDKDADGSSWDPFNGTPYARRKSSAPGDVLAGEPNDQDTRVSGDWVVVPRGNAVPPGSHPPRTAPEDSGIGMSSQPGQSDDRPTGLKRDPSFGLPMIRRSTTLDFGLKDALGSDDKVGTPSEQHPDVEGTIPSEQPAADGFPPTGPPAPSSGDQRSADPASGQAGAIADQPPIPSQSNNHIPDRAQERSQAQASLPLLQTQNSAQKAVRPPGQWNLQESYLSEPLHQVSRKRSGTDDSQQLTYGLDKEMGITSSSPISPPTIQPRQRGGNQLPPSSAQRYPELFTNTQPQNAPRGRSNSGSNIMGAGFPRTESNEFDIPGVGPPEERGRRKSSSIFKEFGNRIGRASSRDRRPSVSDSRPTTSEIVRPDGASETNVWAENNQDRRKKRSSLLSGLRSRPSMEMTTQGNDLRPENGPTVIQSQGYASASQNALPLSSEEERKSKSVFAADKLKLRSSRTERWDSTEDQPDQGPNKSRLSGLGGKVAGLAGAFRRPQSEQSQQHGQASMAANNFNEEARQTSQQQAQAAMAPPPPPGEPHEGRGRRGSASAVFSGLLGRGSSRNREQQGPSMGQPPYNENANNQAYAGRPSMDQRPSGPDALAQQPAPSASIRPVGQSPPPELSRKEDNTGVDAGRFETVSPELSVRSGGQNASGRVDEDPRNVGVGAKGPGLVGAPSEQRPFMPQSHSSDMSRPAPPQSNVSPPLGGYYEPRQPPHGQPQMHQPMHHHMQMPPPQHQGSFGPLNPQSSELLRQQSSQQDMLNVPGSRHSSISLQSSNQGRPSEGQQGSRWRGFKNRISGQLAPQTQEEGSKKEDRMSGSKLFGAFKRGSKQPSAPPVSMHQNASRSQQWSQQQQQGMPQQGPQSQPQHMVPHASPHMQQGMMPPPQQQQQFAQPQGYPQRPGMGPNPYDSYQRQPSTGGSPGQHQQPFPQAHGPAGSMPGPRSPPQMHGPPGHQMQPERQYEQVPIPGPYGVVSGQGHALNMDRQMQNYSTSFQYNSPGRSPPPNQWQQAPQQHAVQGQLNGSTRLPGPSSGTHIPGQAPGGFETRQFNGPQGTPPPPSQGANQLPPGGRMSPQKPFHPPASSPPPNSALPPPPSVAGRPDYPRGDSEVLPAKGGSITRKPTIPKSGTEQQAPHTPVSAAQVNGGESKNSANLSVDVAKAEADKEDDIYDATPRIVQGKMGQKSPEPAAPTQSPTPATKAIPAPTITTEKKEAPAGGSSFAMELEDTEEARKRTIRLDSQEEKIYYDPADDDDNPTMSATSYPGQEWNPYGEFDYSDLGDEPHPESVRGR